ncbi:MAG TPA: FAD-binding protein, partial [Alphaproteobacteria bacterium]|nr:FAD-binding protein [Alphaproteobacteria bacterium]
MTDTTLVRPENSSAVVDAVKAATAARKTIEIIGGGTKRGLGHAVSADIACDLTGLSGISLLEPEELVMTVASGTPVAEIEAALAETGQQL